MLKLQASRRGVDDVEIICMFIDPRIENKHKSVEF